MDLGVVLQCSVGNKSARICWARGGFWVSLIAHPAFQTPMKMKFKANLDFPTYQKMHCLEELPKANFPGF